MKTKFNIVILSILILSLLLISGCSQNDKKASANSTEEMSTDNSSVQDTQVETSEQSNADSQSETSESVLATDFEVTLVTGETVKLSDYRGKKVLLNFWATWCGPCVQEMPAFQKLSEDYPDDIVILAVNCGDSESDVKDFVNENGYTFNIAIDESLEVSSLYPTSSIPLTLIIDEEGYVIYGSYGASDADTMYELYKEELGL